jgi:hypothetical protein
MAIAFWTGTTSKVFALAANWNPAAIPSDGDTLVYNDDSTQGMDGGAIAAKGFAVIVDRGFVYEIGSSGTPFDPANGFTTIVFLASTILPCYFDGSGTIARLLVDTESNRDDLVNVQGTATDVTVRAGKTTLDSGATVTGSIKVMGGTGGANGVLTVPSGATLTNAEISVSGGKMTTGASLTTAIVNGGELILDGAAGVTTRLEAYDGVTWWDAASTIALAEIFGGALKTRKDRSGRTLTSGNMYGNGDIDFTYGGLSMTITNPIRAYGNKQPKFPKGASYTAGV